MLKTNSSANGESRNDAKRDPRSFDSLTEVLRFRSEVQHDRHAYTFLVDGELETRTLTYGELDAAARGVAQLLRETLDVGARALLLYPPGMDYITAFWGCLYAGVVPVPAYPPDPSRLERTVHRLRAIAEDSRSEAVLTTSVIRSMQPLLLGHAPSLGEPSWIATDRARPLPPGEAEVHQPTSDELALLQYTSGSTSTPKGVMVRHGNIMANQQMIYAGFAVDPASDLVVGWLPFHHDMGLIGNMLHPVYAGMPTVLMSPQHFLQRPLRWLQAISRYGGTIAGGPNFAYDLCVRKTTPEQRAQLDLSSWRLAMNGAEPIRPGTVARFADAFEAAGFRSRAMYPCYGLAEATLYVTGGPVRDDPRAKSFPDPAGSGTVELMHSGVPSEGQTIVIADPETLEPLPEGQSGEICLAGPNIPSGYWERPDITEAVFRAHVPGHGPMLRTGDLGFVVDGALYVNGRVKDLIIIRGSNHYPQDIELTVEADEPRVRPGCTVAVEHGESGIAIAVELSKPLDEPAQSQLVRDLCLRIARDHDIAVRALVLLPKGELPKTSSGKVQRQRVKQGLSANEYDECLHVPDATSSPSTPVPPTPSADPTVLAWHGLEYEQRARELERWLCERLAHAAGLKADAIDRDAPMAVFGIDSLEATMLVEDLEVALERSIPLSIPYERPTVRQMAAFLARDVDTPDADPLTQSGPVTDEPEAPPEGDDGSIAIVGIGVRVPGASDTQQLWTLLEEGVDLIREVPASRPDYRDHLEAQRSGRMVAREGGFLDEVDAFDAQFFAISPGEAKSMDPQHRLVLEVAWEALENAGMSGPSLRDSRTGVYVGMSNRDYLEHHAKAGSSYWSDPYAGTGTQFSTAAGRVSHVLGLQGPALSVDTACSSSLVCVHMACQGLRAKETDLALAGGVNLMLSPSGSVYFSSIGALSPDGRCKAFDAAADGFGRAEGCAFVALKRLSDALEDGDPIWAVIRGSAVNHDGRSFGLTAPNGQAQEAVLQAALADAAVDPPQVGYVEAHGTGTKLGDPIEMAALTSVYGRGRPANDALYVGSAKSNFGHLEAAAGVTGLVKTALMLHHGRIAPHLHLTSPNPLIPWDTIPVRVPTHPEAWTCPSSPRFAGVSSFGMAGTNAHVVLQEAPRAGDTSDNEDTNTGESPQVLCLSARSEAALRDQAERFSSFAETTPLSLGELASALQRSRSQMEHRAAWVVRSHAELTRELSAFAEGETGPSCVQAKAGSERPRVGWLMSGQGTQYPNMGRELYESESVFRESMDECDALSSLHLDDGLLERLYADSSAPEDSLAETAWLQPALFALEVSLGKLWQSWGVQPDLMLGHSVGEFAAACLAGVFSLQDGLRLVIERGRAMQSCAPGAMASIRADETTVRELVDRHPEDIAIAAVNGPQSVVISGEAQRVAEVTEALKRSGAEVRRLSVSHAFHSPMMAPAQERFRTTAEQVDYASPNIPIVSSVTGQLADERMASADYWVNQLRQPVQFADALGTAHARGLDIVMELGPEATLLGLHQRVVRDPSVARLPSLSRQGKADRTLRSLANLHVRGVDVHWPGARARNQLHLPTYAFQRRSYWVHSTPEATKSSSSSPAPVPSALPEDCTQAQVRDRLREIIAELLHYEVESVAMDTPFVEMGVDSLMLVEGVQRIQAEFGVTIPLRDLLTLHPSPQSLARHLSSSLPTKDDGSVSVAREEHEVPASNDRDHHQATVEAAQSSWTVKQRAHLDELTRRIVEKTPGSKARKAEGHQVLADVRSSAGYRASFPDALRGEWLSKKELCYPVVASRSEGSRIWDVDDNEYIDFTMGFGVHLFGHSPQFVTTALHEQIARGMQIGPQSDLANRVASLASEITGMPRIAFCTSGSEAVMNALRIARAATGRPKVAMFAGAYHGSFDGVLSTISRTEGCIPGVGDDVIVVEYGSEDALRILREHAHELAAVLVEPVQSRRPELQPREFLHALRAWTRDADIALIFDEVMVGFRLALRGAQEYFGVSADIVTYGKIVGGGLPIGLVAGQPRFMDKIDGGSWNFGDESTPTADTVWFAGTFHKNPLTLAAAHATLRHLQTEGPDLQRALNQRVAASAERLNGAFQTRDLPLEMVHAGSLFRLKLPQKLDILYGHLLDLGIYVWEGRTMFLSTAHSDADIAALETAILEAADRLDAAGFFDEARAQRRRLESTPRAPALRVLCFPYAGGGSSAFARWSRDLPGEVELVPVPIPGRDERADEAAIEDYTTLVTQLARELRPRLNRPFVLFGHSMGALVMHGVARVLERAHGIRPELMIVSGEPAPDEARPPRATKDHENPDEAIAADLEHYGMPRQLLDNPEFREQLLPLLRVDMAVYESYRYEASPPSATPIVALYGERDPTATREQMARWKQETSARFGLQGFAGDHFFIRTAHEELIAHLHRELARLLETTRSDADEAEAA